MKRNIILIAIYIILGLVCVLLNYSIPLAPFADNDTSGYLSSALSWYSGQGFTHVSSRSFLYPLFVTICLKTSGSLNGITVFQIFIFIISLCVFIHAWHKLIIFSNSRFRMLLIDGLGILFFLLIGFSYVTVYFNHSIRPESLFVSCILILMATVIKLFIAQVAHKKTFSLLRFSMLIYFNLAMAVFYPRWLFAFVLITLFLLYQIYRINHQKWFLKIIGIIVPFLLFFITIWIPEQNLINQYDNYGRHFAKQQFYYTHYNLVENDIDKQLDISYKADGVNHRRDIDRKFFTVLGYNPDALMYGITGKEIERNLDGKVTRVDSFYTVKSQHIIWNNKRGYSKKIIRQFASFACTGNSVNIIPNMYQLNTQNEYTDTYKSISQLLVTFPDVVPLQNHAKFIKQYRSYSSPPFFALSYIVWPFQLAFKFIFSFLFIVFIITSFLVIIKKIKLVSTLTHVFFNLSVLLGGITFCMVLLTAMVHTFDMVRYWMCFLPISFAFCTCSFLFLISLIKLETEEKLLCWVDKKILNRKMLGMAVIFLLLLHGVTSLYYYKQYHFFDPYVQNQSPRFSLPRKEKDELRVLMLGGSTTANLHLPEEQRYPYLLEKKLQVVYPQYRVKVLNAGNDWYSTRHSLINYSTYYYQFKPDIVVIMHAINDLYRSFSPRDFAYGEYDSLYNHFYGPSMQGVDPPTFTRYLTRMSVFGDLSEKFISYNQTDYRLEDFKSINAFDANLRRLVYMCKADSAQVIIVSQPNLYNDNMSETLVKKCWFNKQFCNRRISNFSYEYPSLKSMNEAMSLYNQHSVLIAAEHKVLFIPAADILPKSDSLFVDDVHYTSKGCEVLSELVKDSIVIYQNKKHGIPIP